MYKLYKNQGGKVNGVFRLVDMAAIPFDPANTDYQAYLRWCEEGNEVLPADENAAE
jgi:hypothetical protein